MLYNPDWKPAETETETWRTVLRSAADLIEKHGWAIGKPLDTAGRMCFLGAIAMAEGVAAADIVLLGKIQPSVYAERESVVQLAKFITETGRAPFTYGDNKYTSLPSIPSQMPSYEIVYHCNDHLISSKKEAVALLREAADFKGI